MTINCTFNGSNTQDLKVCVSPHLPNSIGFVLSEYFVFVSLKETLSGKKFQNNEAYKWFYKRSKQFFFRIFKYFRNDTGSA